VWRQLELRGWHTQNATAPRALSPWSAWKQRILNAFSKEPVIDPEQLAWIYEALQGFSAYLSSNPVPSLKHRVALRADLSYCQAGIERALPPAERRARYEVEHFYGNTDIRNASLSQVVGEAWPED
jgi:hypothetical protein